MKIIAAIITFFLASCTISEVSVHGRFGEYIFKPYRPIIIESK